ncbi:patatin family protein [Sphingomonas cavernae]|uniref:Patatin family protein n=2 Tax=Sphingomonas cavernae TaxID=2320861 RepID=A0A418WSQ7_9SPHN|nr:patatin family protein [Sphingomonas cavernae]
MVTGCATPERLPAVPTAATVQAETGLGPVRFFVRRDVSGFETEAKASLARELAYRASVGQHGPLPPAYFLAISGGGDNGAFGAGLLNGWTASGTRPEFKAVTGISTGALIAPFAFLGPKYDHVLEEVYTRTSQRDIFRLRGMIRGFFSDAMADTTPLYELVTRYADQALLDAIAAEYAKGRLLLVGTTALDSLEPVIWNMTAIAASKDPRAPELFRRILVASASIPGVFPPVMLDVTVGGQRYQEMHVDGGTIAQVFLYPPSLHMDQSGPAAGRKRLLYIIRNARLDPDWASVDRRTLPVAARAISSLTQTQGIGDLYRIFTTTRRDGIDYNLAFIPPTFNVPHREEFDTNYMQHLFATGRQMAVAGYRWQKFPPGYSE